MHHSLHSQSNYRFLATSPGAQGLRSSKSCSRVDSRNRESRTVIRKKLPLNANANNQLSAECNFMSKSIPKGLTRCVTPISTQASEAHIHRIRSAASIADFKHQCKVTSSYNNLSKLSPSIEWLPEPVDEDDVESVDWTAPLDITTYLYKLEYIICEKQSSDNMSQASTAMEMNSMSLDCNNPENEVVPLVAATNDEQNSSKTSMKAELVENYVKRSMERKAITEFDRTIQDCAEFVKNIRDDIRQMTAETKRLEMYSPRNKTWRRETKEAIIERGYSTLKRLYELNPELTESAAKKYIGGPPGNHWMGMSRVEVLEVMQSIRSEFGVPPDDNHANPAIYQSLHRRGTCRSLDLKRSFTSKNGLIRSKDKPRTRRTQTAKEPRMPKIKPAQMMPQHIPGPKHLHTNVCIRPWEATVDGWSKVDCIDIEEERKLTVSARASSSEESHSPQRPNTRKTLESPPSTGNTLLEDLEASNDEDGEGDYITLEIFNPVFRVSR